MTLQSSGPISLQDIEDEFGGAGAIAISEYYGAADGVPGSGAISFSDFYGTSAVVVTLSGQIVASLLLGGSVSFASIRVNIDGTIDEFRENGAGYTQIDSGTDWIIPNSGASPAYEVRVTAVSGDAFSVSPGANGTWFALSSNREWGISDTNPDISESQACDFTLEIRNNGGPTLASAAYSLSTNLR